MYITVQVRCELTDGGLSRGSGFIFTYSKGTTTLPVLITNKHVVSGASRTLLSVPYVHREGDISERRSFNVAIGDGEDFWVGHPDNSIDLCALPLQGVIERMLEHDPYAHHVSVDESLIPSQAELNKLSPFNMSRTLSRGKIGPGPNDMGSGPLPISARPRRPRRVFPTLVFAV